MAEKGDPAGRGSGNSHYGSSGKKPRPDGARWRATCRGIPTASSPQIVPKDARRLSRPVGHRNGHADNAMAGSIGH
jgi:hypothetical protein